MKRKFGVEVELKAPKVPYKETIKGSAKAQGRLKKQTGGRGQFGDTWLEVEPQPRGGRVRVREQDRRRCYSAPVHSSGGKRGPGTPWWDGYLAGYELVDVARHSV